MAKTRPDHDTSPILQDGMPAFAALRAFDALVRTGGVRRAAEDLGLHHSVVSRHVSQLESWLGVALLLWSGKRFVLTPQGSRFHPRIAAAIAEIAGATREVVQAETARPIRVWCSQGLAIGWLAAQLTELERASPSVRVQLRPSDTEANLLAHEADVNLFMRRENEMADDATQGLKIQPVARPRSMIVASPTLAAQLVDIGSARELLTVPLLHERHTDDWRWWFMLNDVDPPGDLAGELCWHSYMALEAARLGRGILLGNRFFFEKDIERGDLVALDIPGTTDAPFGAYLFEAREDRWSSKGIVTLRRFLTTRMKAMERER